MAEEWMARAACKGMDTDLWFKPGYGTLPARRVCAQCPVTMDCLDSQMRYEEDHHTYRYGIFGGMFPEHRRLLADVRR